MVCFQSTDISIGSCQSLSQLPLIVNRFIINLRHIDYVESIIQPSQASSAVEPSKRHLESLNHVAGIGEDLYFTRNTYSDDSGGNDPTVANDGPM